MTVYHWMAIGLACLYGGATALGGMHQIRYRTIPHWSALGMLLGGMAVILSAVLTIANTRFGLWVVPGLLLLHLLAIWNGFHLHGRIHPAHHLIRFALSLMIALPLAFWG